MKYSLILCTLNREDMLLRCISSLQKQSFKDYEIIVVDQSDNETKKLSNKMNITYIYEKKKGLSNARNIAISNAKSDYCCLIDDDAIYPEDWLQTIDNVLGKNQYDLISGRICDPDTGKYALGGSRESSKQNLGHLSVLHYCMSACSVIKTEILKRTLFDDRFGAGRHWGAGEETDVFWSIIESGGVVSYYPQVKIFHHVGTRKDVSLDRIESYNLGFGALYAKHSNLFVVRILFIYALFRNIAGMIIFAIMRNQDGFKRQKIAFDSKKTGYKEYRTFV